MDNTRLSIKAWRKVREISQERMAEMLGVHVNTYARWEENPKDISVMNAHQIAKILTVKFDDINFLS